MRYLITGVAGFIGSHLLETLLARGNEVIGIDNFATGHRHNIAPFLNDFEFVEGDIRDEDLCARVCSGVDAVLHQGALGSVPRSVSDPATTHAVNVTGTLNMLIAARDAGASAFVFAASSSAYGDTPTLPKQEDMTPRPRSPYAISKLASEQYCQVFHQLYDLPTVCLRYFNIFGPRQDPQGPYAAVIPRFVASLREGNAVTIDGDGEQTRDFTFVSNAVDANLNAVQFADRAAGSVINIACGDHISINQLYHYIADALGSDLPPNYGAPRVGDVRDSLADISRARELIDYQPSVSVADGIQQTVRWFLEI